MRKRTIITMTGLMVATALATTGCLSTQVSTPSVSGSATAKDTLTIMYGMTGDQGVAFKGDLQTWAAKNGMKINFIQTDSFETLIQTKVASGDLPDIAVFPQPGLLKGMAAKGLIAPLNTQVNLDSVKNDLVPGFLDAGTVNNTVYGAPVSMNVKSLYWYDKAAFAAAGLTVPKTETDLEALIAKVKAAGKAPICYGMESGSGTGWPATDWIEDYMLQTNTPQVYDQWVSHDIKFDSPEVRKAFDVYTKLIMTDGNVYGGAKNSASISFMKTFNPMFEKNPGCYIGKQGNFITAFFPKDVLANLDSRVGVFSTPSVDGQNPMLGGGDLAAAFTANDTNVKKLMNYLVNDPTFGIPMIKAGSTLSPHKSFDPANYPNNTTREIVKLTQQATTFRFDGSDQMPGAVGSKSFWTGMVDYTTGAKTLDQTLQAIDKSWPQQ